MQASQALPPRRAAIGRREVAQARELVGRLGLATPGDAVPFACAMQPFAATLLESLAMPTGDAVLVHEALALECAAMPAPDAELEIAGTRQIADDLQSFELSAADAAGHAIGLSARIRTAPPALLARRAGAQRPRGARVATVAIDARMLADYARLSGDENPIHLDRELARSIGLPAPVVHGSLLAFLVEPALAAPSGALRRLGMRFLAPAFAGERLHLHLWREAGAPRARLTIAAEGGPVCCVAEAVL
jgi:acyl dehydratase